MIEFFGQRAETSDIAVVLLLIVLEGVLSIDNALVLGLLAKRLPKHQQKKALTYGLVGAFVFRVRMIEFCLIRARINREQQIALLDLLSFLEMNLVEITADARPHLDGLR